VKFSFPIATFTFILTTCLLSDASAGGSLDTANAASGHASAAVTMGAVAVGQATIGVLAVPMLSVGASGSAAGPSSTKIGQASAAAAGSPTNGPLPLTDKTITVTSPAEALKPTNTTTPR
jgi:hypothetical protein